MSELAPKKDEIMEKHTSFETKQTMLIMDYILLSEEKKTITIVITGYLDIKCGCQLSIDFLRKTIKNISNDCEMFRFGFIPLKEIPKRPRAKKSLPQLTGYKIR